MTIREWPYPVKKKALQLYLQRYTAPEIEKRVGIPKGTIRRWSSDESWCDLRDKVVLNLDEVAKDLVRDSLYGINTAVRSACKILTYIEGQLDAPTPARPIESTPEATSHNIDAAPAAKADAADTIATLAGALKDTSDILLRVFNK